MAASPFVSDNSSSDSLSAAQASSIMSRLDGRCREFVVVVFIGRRSFVACRFLLSDIILFVCL